MWLHQQTVDKFRPRQVRAVTGWRAREADALRGRLGAEWEAL